jgi:branched-chain amino acid transport system substrate-binding protein
MKKSTLFFALLAIIGAFVLLAWLVRQKLNSNDGPTISAILPLTGSLSFMGQPEKNGMELAVADYRAKTGSRYKNLTFVTEDSQSTPQGAVTAAQKLLQVDKPLSVLIANTGPNLAIAPITEKNKVLQIAFCMEPDIQRKHSLVFRLYESATQEGEAILNYLNANRQKYRRIGFLYIDQPNFVKTVEGVIAPGLAGAEAPAIFMERYRLDQPSFRPVLSKFMSQGIDCLVLLGYGSEYRLIFDQMKELSLLSQTKIVGGWGFLYPQVSADLLEGVYVASPTAAIADDAVSARFRKSYRERFKELPNFDAAYAYSAFAILLDALDQSEGGITSELLAQHIEGRTFDTAVGRVSVTDRELIVPVTMAVYIKGNLEPLP